MHDVIAQRLADRATIGIMASDHHVLCYVLGDCTAVLDTNFIQCSIRIKLGALKMQCCA